MENIDKKVDFVKWIINTVVIGLLTFFFNWVLQERKQGIEEIKTYDKYVELVTNVNGLAERRLLAEFFSYVTPSKKLKEGWKKYYDTLNKQYLLRLKESKLTIKTADTATYQGKVKYDKAVEMKEMLENVGVVNPIISTKNAKAALEWELKGFKALLNKEIDSAILAFENSENSYNSFHQVYEIALYLKRYQTILQDPNSPQWKEVYLTLISEYSWKMPSDIKRLIAKKSR